MEFKVSGFAGMDNLQDSARLKGPTVSEPTSDVESVQIVNFDITDTRSASTRQGVTKITSGAPHSWDPNGSGLFVDGNYLKLLLPDLSTVFTVCPLKSPSSRMSYTPVNYLTVCSNGVDLIIVENGVATPFPQGVVEALADQVRAGKFWQLVSSGLYTAAYLASIVHKESIRPAQIVAFYMRRLWYAVRSVLYYSDADNIEQTDTEDPPFVFNAPITMVMPLDNGIYVGADKVYWLAGRGPEDFVINGVAYDGQVVKGTDVAIEGALANLSGKWGMFTAFDGVCLCSDNGQVNNLTLKKISFHNGQQGASLIKQSAGLLGNINQYISWV